MKKRFFLFMLALFFVLPASITLVACGGNNNGGGEQKQIISGQIKYKGDYTFELDEYDGLSIRYFDGITFANSDFEVELDYSDGSKTVVQGTDPELNFKIYTYDYDEVTGESVEVVVTNFETGYYYASYQYKDWIGSLSFRIVAYDIETDSKFSVSYQEDNYYKYEEGRPDQAAANEPAVAVYYDGIPLVEGEDYAVEYSNNYNLTTDDSKAHLTVTGRGKFAGSKTYDFNILPIEISQEDVHAAVTSANLSTDYILALSQFNLVEENIDETKVPVGFYDNTYYKITKDGTLVFDNRNSIGTYESVTDAGTYEIEYSFSAMKGFVYNGTNPTATLVINKLDISNWQNNDITVSYNFAPHTTDEYNFNSDGIGLKKPGETNYVDRDTAYTVEMIDDGTTLVEGVVADNRNATNATRTGAIRVTGIGNYTGTKVIAYTISPRAINEASVDFGENPSSFEYDGAEHKAVPAVQVYDNTLSVWNTLTEGTDYTLAYPTDCTTAGTKIITISGGSNGNFVGSKTATFNVTKKVINIGEALEAQNWQAGYSNPLELIYNGTNQVSAALPSAIENVVISYEIKTNEDVPGETNRPEVPLTEIVKGKADPYDHYRVYVDFALADGDDEFGHAYSDNYELSNIPSDTIKYVYVRPLQIQDSSFAESANFDGSTEPYPDTFIPYYTFDGTIKAPKLVITTQYGTLVENTDYTMYYRSTNSYDNLSAIDAGEYDAAANFADEAGYQNYCAYSAQTYYENVITKRFDILAATLTSEQQNAIVYPSVYRYIWGDKAYFDLDIKTTQTENDTISIGGSNSTLGHFELAMSDQGYGSAYPYVDSSNQIEIRFVSNNYETVSKTVDTIIFNPFTSFKVNNVAVQTADIEGLALKAGDKVEIAIPEGYSVTYKAYGSYGYNTYNYFGEDTLTVVIGGERSTDDRWLNELILENRVVFSIIKGDSDVSESSGHYNVNLKSMFTTLGIYTSTDEEDIDILKQNDLEWSFDEGKKLKAQMAYANYTVSYHVVKLDGTSTSESAEASTFEYQALPNDSQIVVTYKNALGDIIFVSTHVINHDYSEVFGTAGVWKGTDTTVAAATGLTNTNPSNWPNILTGERLLEVGQTLKFEVAIGQDYKFSILADGEEKLTKETSGTYTVENGVQELEFKLYLVYNSTEYLAQDVTLTIARNRELMTLSVNPSIEFVVGRDNKIETVNALNEDANLVIYRYNFTGLTPEQAVELFVEAMQEEGFVFENSNLTLTVDYSDQTKRAALQAVAETKAQELNLESLTFDGNTISPNTILSQISAIAKEYTSTELEAMNTSELLSLLAEERNATSTIVSSNLKDLYYLLRAETLVVVKIETLIDLLRDNTAYTTLVNALGSIKDNLETTMANLVSIYENFILKSSSPFVIAKISFAEAKKNLLMARSGGLVGEDYLTELQEALDSAERLLTQAEESISQTLASATEALDNIYAELDNQIKNLALNASDMAEIESVMSEAKTEFETSFATNYTEKYNINVWANQAERNIRAEGTPEYTIFDSDNWTTYSFNKDEISDGVYTYVVYLYEGPVSDFAAANPYMLYQYFSDVTENNGMLIIMNKDMKKFKVENGEISVYLPTVVYSTYFMGTNLNLCDDGIIYVYGNYAAGTWTEDNDVVTAVIDGVAVVLDVDDGELVLRPVEVSGTPVYVFFENGYTYSLNNNGKGYLYSGKYEIENIGQASAFAELTWSLDANTKVLTLVIGGVEAHYQINNDNSITYIDE